MDSKSLSAVGLVGLAGAVSQAGGLALLVVLFASLREHGRRTSYFPSWKTAWVSAFLALIAITLRYSPLPGIGGVAFWSLRESDLQVRSLYFIYESAKFFYLALVVTGTHLFVRGRTGLPSSRALLVTCLGLGAVSVAAAPNLNAVLMVQVFVAIPVFTYSSYLLISLPRTRRSWGSISLGITLLGHTVLWGIYGFGFAYSVWIDPVQSRNPLHLLLNYNSFVDLFGCMLLGYSMVNVLMEDATRVIAAAHAELAAAHDQLRRAALFDPMTGALNRRAFSEGLGLERVKASFGVVAMLDVDNLKPVNDTHGHAVGDALLRHLVSELGPALRATDKLYRWGGDEFLIVMPTAVEHDALARLSSLLNDAPPLIERDVAIPLRVSLGVASYRSVDQLVDAVTTADRAMYETKAKRRARPGLIPTPLLTEPT